jgi:hypothetical protein
MCTELLPPGGYPNAVNKEIYTYIAWPVLEGKSGPVSAAVHQTVPRSTTSPATQPFGTGVLHLNFSTPCM